MEIKRLTITPIAKSYSKIISRHPDTELAASMIKEHLEMAYGYKSSIPKSVIRRQLPKFLRNMVNLDTLVVK